MERLNPINMLLEPTDPLKERSIIFCRQVGNITDMQARLTISLQKKMKISTSSDEDRK